MSGGGGAGRPWPQSARPGGHLGSRSEPSASQEAVGIFELGPFRLAQEGGHSALASAPGPCAAMAAASGAAPDATSEDLGNAARAALEASERAAAATRAAAVAAREAAESAAAI